MMHGINDNLSKSNPFADDEYPVDIKMSSIKGPPWNYGGQFRTSLHPVHPPSNQKESELSCTMHSLVYFLLIAVTSCLAHYRGSSDSRNFVVREEPSAVEGVLIECPVCEDSDHWMASNEDCPIRKGNKSYKICKFGTYTNEVCGKRPDCYRGPREQCTVKREFDMYGKKCAPGYYCHKWAGVCTGPEFRLDSNWQWQLIPFTGRRSELKAQPDDTKFTFEGIRN